MEDCCCDEKCLSKLPQQIREHLYGSYQKLTTSNEKYLYLSGLIYKEGKRKQFLFHIRIDGCNRSVCRKTFEKIYHVSSRNVGKVLAKLKNNVISLNPESDDELFAESVRMKQTRSTSAKDQAISHIKSKLLTPEVKEHILKGETINLAMFHSDYKSTLEKKRRMAASNFDHEESENNENDQEAVDYKPMSLATFKVLFDTIYPDIVEMLKRQSDVTLSRDKQLPSLSLPGKSSSIPKKLGACVKKAVNRQNSTKRPKLLLTKKKIRVSTTVLKQNDLECRSGDNLCTIVDDSNHSAVYLLPTSAKILNNAN